jgi:hypothetical protein
MVALPDVPRYATRRVLLRRHAHEFVNKNRACFQGVKETATVAEPSGDELAQLAQLAKLALKMNYDSN